MRQKRNTQLPSRERVEDFDKLLDEIENAEMIFNDTITAGSLPK